MSPTQVVGTRRRTGPRTPTTLVTRIANAKSVAAIGEFNEWSPEGIPMSMNEHGEWFVTFRVQPGEYEYRLLVDGQWHDHPEAVRRVPNPFGGENCVLTVS